MDFLGFILFILLALCWVGGVITAIFTRITVVRRTSLLFMGGVSLLLALLGWFIYQVYFLDEALAIAAMEGDTAQVKSLLARGASPNAEFNGHGALTSAIEHKDKEIIRLLKQAGAR